MPINLETDVLRTLIAICDNGGVNRAAGIIGRSQSAVSLQIRKLEQQVGTALFQKKGRRLVLTEAGDVLLNYARRILVLNDDAVSAVKGLAIEGSVRFGMPSDFAETWMPTVLGRFKRVHPDVHIEAKVDRNVALLEALDAGKLDLALVFGSSHRPDAKLLATLPIVWVGPQGDQPSRQGRDAVPLVLFEPPCLFREAGLEALNQAGIPWRVSFTTHSLAGAWAAVGSGLGVTPRLEIALPSQVRVLRETALPAMPTISLALHSSRHSLSPAALRFQESLLETFPL
ncbi:LysR family transcriptional regulator [Microvirga sp. KLBC 81]|uniref:LysR substrate-binding domain-containing protein n=1 Tax=Microvirga sp. KLBC 81 TaxID=1862707 RepID=UPI000D50CEA7|nr:LysR substrate-binding domain-containing protein [Microvirga sp. KLBC 81]PVE25129.1 LysR family transcriptional regulator [Microvirga sp. KLBC 81]